MPTWSIGTCRVSWRFCTSSIVMGVALVNTAGGAGFADSDSTERGQGREESAPYPPGDVFARRVGKALDLVEVAVVELLKERLEGALDVGKVHHPPRLLVHASPDVDRHAE